MVKTWDSESHNLSSILSETKTWSHCMHSETKTWSHCMHSETRTPLGHLS
jgi:hypothetical protein